MGYFLACGHTVLSNCNRKDYNSITNIDKYADLMLRVRVCMTVCNVILY